MFCLVEMHFLRDRILVDSGFIDEGLKEGGTCKHKQNYHDTEVS